MIWSGKFRGRQKISLSTNFASLTRRGKLVKPTEFMQFWDAQNMWYFLTHAQNIASQQREFLQILNRKSIVTQLSYLNVDGMHAPCRRGTYLILNSKRKKRCTHLSSIH